MIRSQEIFLDLLRAELWQEPVKEWGLTQEDCEQALHVAVENSCLGPVLNTLFRNNVKMGTVNVTKGVAVTQGIRLQNEKVNMAVAKLAHLLNDNAIEYIVFKGQTVGLHYPDPLLRSAGDIDFYVTPKDYERAEQLLMKSYEVDLGNERLDMHDSFKADGVVYELHFRMETFGSNKHQRYYDKLIEEQVSRRDYSVKINDTDVLTLSPTLNVIQVFKHLFHHLLIEGVGMRQVCDLAMLISRTHNEIDWDMLGHHLKKIGYYKAFLAMGALLITHLGLPQECFGFASWKKYVRWGDKILSNVFERGNFGKFNRKHSKPGLKKSLETARIAMGHCLTFLPLATSDIIPLIPKRIVISLSKKG